MTSTEGLGANETAEECPGGITPPAYLQEDLGDFLVPSNPRLVVVTHRRWMEPYHSLEEAERTERFRAGHWHSPALVMWLRQIGLFCAAFSRGYDWSSEPNREAKQSAVFRLDLLGLAGGNSKLALDAMMAGYYSGCLALERHMLETWRRVAYARLCTEDIWRWYPQDMWPDDVKPTPEGKMATKHPNANEIGKVIEDRGTDRDKAYLPKVQGGFDSLNDHVHPTVEGATQTWSLDGPNHRVFGPTYSDLHCRRCLKWGLSAGAMLLEEIALIGPQGEDWLAELGDVEQGLGEWLRVHQN